MEQSASDSLVQVKLPGGLYNVHIAPGALERLGALMSGCFKPGRVLVVTDSRVEALYGQRCREALAGQGWQVSMAVLRPGERSKTLSGAARLYNSALQAGLDRGTPLVALGGGVVGDLAGFVAATFMRGLPLVMAPTTLLAQVDSSVGGKVAVNHPHGKNLIGAFYQPALVVADPGLLGSLPARQRRAGLAEVIKYALIREKPFFYWLQERWDLLARLEPESLAEAITRSVRAKAAVVEQDEKESGYRQLLNFGHTIGHALEAATGYRYYLHGEAVLIGMAAAAELSRATGLLDASDAGAIQALLSRVGFLRPPADLSVGEITERLAYDKKRRAGKNVFVLLGAIGGAIIQEGVEIALVEKILQRYLRLQPPFAKG